MALADDVIARADKLAAARSAWESVWADCVALCLPMHAAIGYGFTSSALQTIVGGPVSEERGRKIYDSVGVMGVDRLTAGIESLVTPQSEKWHGLQPDDAMQGEPSDVEKEWFDQLTDYLFRVRYDTRSGFVASHQMALRSCIALGTGVSFIEECYGLHGVTADRLPIRYQNVPLNECLIAVNCYNEPDTLFRRHSLTARQIVQKFSHDLSRVPEKIKLAAADAKKMDDTFELIHATFPREDYDKNLGVDGAVRNAPFASCVVDVESKTVIRTGGYHEFPFGVYYWHHAGGGYAECPVMFALAELKSLQVMNKTGMLIMQQHARPPLAISHDGVTNRPNLNPGATNPNAIDDNGRLKIQPIITGGYPALFLEYMIGKREIAKEMLYLTLFQTLIRNPTMTATEALIRANEKGELLGPSGSKIQATMSRSTDRELGILGRKGLFDQGHPMSPPISLGGRSVGTKMTSPLDRIRRAKELLGAHATVERILMLAKFDPSVMDKLDTDEYVDLTQTIEGAPRKILRTDDEVKKIREGRQKAQAQDQTVEQGKNMAEAMTTGAEALDAVGNLTAKYGPGLKAAADAKGAAQPGGAPTGAA